MDHCSLLSRHVVAALWFNVLRFKIFLAQVDNDAPVPLATHPRSKQRELQAYQAANRTTFANQSPGESIDNVNPNTILGAKKGACHVPAGETLSHSAWKLLKCKVLGFQYQLT